MDDLGTKTPQNKQEEKEVKAKAEENPLKLEMELNSLEVGNQQTFDEILQGYKNLIADIDVQLKSPETTPEEKKKLVQQKKEYQIKIKELQTKYPEFVLVVIKREEKPAVTAVSSGIARVEKAEEFWVKRQERIRTEDAELSKNPKDRQRKLLDYIRRGHLIENVEIQSDLIALTPDLLKAGFIDFNDVNYDEKKAVESFVVELKKVEVVIVKEDQMIRAFLSSMGVNPKQKNIYLDNEWYKSKFTAVFEASKKPKDSKNPQSVEEYATVQREKLKKKLEELFLGDVEALVVNHEANPTVVNINLPERESTPVLKFVFEKRPKNGFVNYPKLSEYKGVVVEEAPRFVDKELRSDLVMVSRDKVPSFRGGIILDGNFGYDERGEPLRPDDKIIIDHHDKFDNKTHDTATLMAMRLIENPEELAKLGDPKYLDENGKLIVITNNLDSDSILSTWAIYNRKELLALKESNEEEYLRLKNIMYEITRSGDFLLGGNALDYGATPRDYEYIIRGYMKSCQQQVREGKKDNPNAGRLSLEDNAQILNHMHDVVIDIIKNPFKYQKFLVEGRLSENTAIEQVDSAYHEGDIEITPDSVDPDILFVRPLKKEALPDLASIDGEYFFYRRREDFNRELIVKFENNSFMMAINTQNMKGLEKYDFNKLIDVLREKETKAIQVLIDEKNARLSTLDPKKDAQGISSLKKEIKTLESDKLKNTKGQLWRSRTQMIFAFKTCISEEEIMESIYSWKKEGVISAKGPNNKLKSKN